MTYGSVFQFLFDFRSKVFHFAVRRFSTFESIPGAVESCTLDSDRVPDQSCESRVHGAPQRRIDQMDTPSKAALRPAPPLPEKIEDWQRKIKAERTLNDLVEELHRMVWDSDPRYRALLKAVYDEQAVEGSLSCDNTLAAMALRDKAEKMDGNEVKNEKLATINKALGVVLRRYGQSRKERRNMLGGEIVPGTGGGDNGE
jgi:hypothetical protein